MATITPLPEPPLRGEAPDAFTAKANAFLGALPQFADEANSLAVEANSDADRAESAAESAAGSAAIAQSAQELAHYKGEWGSLSGALDTPASVWHLEQFWILLESVSDVTAHEPGTSTVWTVAAGSSLANMQAVALSF